MLDIKRYDFRMVKNCNTANLAKIDGKFSKIGKFEIN